MPDNNPNLINESEVPTEWEDAPKPATPPPPRPNPPEIPQYFSGSMPPALQHDKSFVGTEVASPRIPKASLMPLGNQGSGFTNAAAQSTVIKEISTTSGSQITLKTNGANNPNQGVLDLEPGSDNVSLSSDGSGAVRISVSESGSGPFMFRPDFKRWTLWTQPGGAGGVSGFIGINDTLTNTISGTVTSALVAASATDDYGVKIQQSANGGYNAITGVQNLIPARAFSLFIPMRISTNSGNIRVWAIASNPNNSSDISAIMTSNTPNRDIVGFRYSTGIGGNWFAVQAQVGGGMTTVDTGVAASTNSVMLQVDYDPTTTTSTYYINGVQVATISTTPPTLTFPLGGMIGVGGSTGSANAINIFSFYSEMRTTVTTT
jgi:hypothetical protein